MQNGVQIDTQHNHVFEKCQNMKSNENHAIYYVLTGRYIRIQHISVPKNINKHAGDPNMLFDASNDRKHQQVIQDDLQRRP